MTGLSDEAFNKVMTSNVHSAIWFANAAMPHMADVGGGSFIIVSSIGGLRGSATLGAYGISKAADGGVARALAVEWGPKEHPCQLHHAGPRQDRLRPRALGR